MSETTKGFDVYKNGQFVGFVIGQSKAVRLATAREIVTATHMGGWSKTDKGFEYGTTIGVYLLFQPCKRLSDTLANYRIGGSK